MRILLVEDDNRIGQSRQQALIDHGLVQGGYLLLDLGLRGWPVTKDAA